MQISGFATLLTLNPTKLFIAISYSSSSGKSITVSPSKVLALLLFFSFVGVKLVWLSVVVPLEVVLLLIRLLLLRSDAKVVEVTASVVVVGGSVVVDPVDDADSVEVVDVADEADEPIVVVEVVVGGSVVVDADTVEVIDAADEADEPIAVVEVEVGWSVVVDPVDTAEGAVEEDGADEADGPEVDGGLVLAVGAEVVEVVEPPDVDEAAGDAVIEAEALEALDEAPVEPAFPLELAPDPVV